MFLCYRFLACVHHDLMTYQVQRKYIVLFPCSLGIRYNGIYRCSCRTVTQEHIENVAAVRRPLQNGSRSAKTEID